MPNPDTEAHGFASQLGGSLTLSSKPGLGTRVDLWLPLSAETAAKGQRDVGAAPAVPHVGKALLIDDESNVRASTADMLMDLGYEVVEVESGVEALKHLESGIPVDLLITDHLMPGMTGTDLAWEVRARWPAVQILIISGFAEAEGIAPDLPRLTKPFRQFDLAEALAGLMLAKTNTSPAGRVPKVRSDA